MYKFGEGPNALQNWIYEYCSKGYSKCLYCYWLNKYQKIDKKDIYNRIIDKYFCAKYPNSIPEDIIEIPYPEEIWNQDFTTFELDYSNHSLCEYYKEYRFDFLDVLKKEYNKSGDEYKTDIPDWLPKTTSKISSQIKDLINERNKEYNYKLKSTIFGIAVGDALGFPYQFKNRRILKEHLATTMEASRRHEAGTYSDDTSMTLCLLASLRENNWGLSRKDIASKFVDWIDKGYMSCEGYAIDIGRTTRKALLRIYNDAPEDLWGSLSINECGNGSLMRTSPLIFYYRKHCITDPYEVCKSVSSITHAHDICSFACYIYVLYGLKLLDNPHNEDKQLIFKSIYKEIIEKVNELDSTVKEAYWRFLNYNKFISLEEYEIESSGYVVDSLEAALWCFLTTNNYKDCILKAVNLGGDTDTIAAIAGGLAGLYYGYDNIPEEWIDVLKNKEVIYSLCKNANIIE